MRITRDRLFAVCAVLAMTSGCVTLSAASRIESQLRDLGITPDRAECLANELADNLDRRDLNSVADFLEDLNRAGSAGGALDALLSIDNPTAAAAIAAAGISCAFSR